MYEPNFKEHPDRVAFHARMDAGDAQAALDAAERLCDAFPGNPEALSLKARALFESGEAERARRLWGLVVDLVSDKIAELDRRFDQQDVTWDDVVPKSAEAEADRLSLLSLADHARLNAAICHDRAGDRDACLRELELAVDNRPQSVYLHAMLALLYAEMQRRTDAEAICRFALELPDLAAFASDWLTLADVCETVGLHQQAAELRERHGGEKQAVAGK